MDSKRIANALSRDLYVLEDESNPRGSKADQIYGATILDQVFDDQSPTRKNLRQILEDLRQEILTGGRGNIVFPVTSVNNKTGDVILRKSEIGLGNVDNTADVDKPLSSPQRNSVMEILAGYNFNVDMQDLYDHLMDNSNPHRVTFDQLNLDGGLERFIDTRIARHNSSVDTSVHVDIRRSLAILWNLVDGINNSLEDRLFNIMKQVDDHINDPVAHDKIFATKEDVANKVTDLNDDYSHTTYPTTRAVVEYVMQRFNEYAEAHPDVPMWLDNISVVDRRENLPDADETQMHNAYIIRKGNTSFGEIALCRVNPSGTTYSWEISDTGIYTRFNSNHFEDSSVGLSLKMSSIVDYILDNNGLLNDTLSEALSKYYTKTDIDDMHLVNAIQILPGTTHGTIRYYINDDMTTMTEDIYIPGLKRLAYLEWVTEKELADNAVQAKHMRDNVVETRHIIDQNVTPEKLSCRYGYVLGNTLHDGTVITNEIKLTELADFLRPLIGGWPDPHTPGGNPWSDLLNDHIGHPHTMTPKMEYNLQNKSYMMRFVGEISCVPEMQLSIRLTDALKLGTHRIIDAGGAWCYQTEPEKWMPYGGHTYITKVENDKDYDYITNRTYSVVTMDKDGINFETESAGDRINARFDIWVKYIKLDEIPEIEIDTDANYP